MQTKNGQNIKTNLFSRQLSVYGNEARNYLPPVVTDKCRLHRIYADTLCQCLVRQQFAYRFSIPGRIS